MTGWLLASYVLLWILMIAVLAIQLVVLRQLGLVYLRSQGGGLHLDEGPEIGAIVNPFSEVDDRTGESWQFPAAENLNLLVFTSPHCTICKDTIRGLRAASPHYEIVSTIISEGEVDENAELHGLAPNDARFVSSVHRQRKLNVQTIPYGILVSSDGVVLDKQIINAVDDLETLVERGSSSPMIATPMRS